MAGSTSASFASTLSVGTCQTHPCTSFCAFWLGYFRVQRFPLVSSAGAPFPACNLPLDLTLSVSYKTCNRLEASLPKPPASIPVESAMCSLQLEYSIALSPVSGAGSSLLVTSICPPGWVMRGLVQSRTFHVPVGLLRLVTC